MTIFCGSSCGNNGFKDSVYEFGKFIAKTGHTLVYGGGNIGLMGAVSLGAKESGGKIIGIIPELLMDKELGNKSADELIVVKTMHERKALLSQTDAFVALPGGLGTLEEIFEVWTHTQLGYHDKPIAFLNLQGFYDGLFEFLNYAVKSGFVAKKFIDMAIVSDDFEEIFEKIREYKRPDSKY